LVGDADGIVVIHKADADLVAEVAAKKKASEDKVFAKMDNRWQDYAESHLASTAKRFAGREPEVVEDDFCNKYGK
ncbi:MAG: RraA family protein, partial [Pyramidobacter sp.]|nr:RraA family protein [Pyramidobacter sp.]